MKPRRDFLKKMAGVTTTIMLPFPGQPGTGKIYRDRLGDILPKRMLGKTGEEVTMLGLGGYHIGWTTEKDARETIEAAMEGGIRFFDSAESYGPHTGEERYGKYLTPKYRDLIFLMTKSYSTDYKTAMQHLNGSLKRMKTDYLDLWQVHSLQSTDDVDERIENRVLDAMIEAKESGKVRHIGFTGHRDPRAHYAMLEKTAGNDIFETIQMPINPVDAAYQYSFTNDVMPEAVDRNFGVLAMKTLADGRFFPQKTVLEDKIWETDNPVVPGIMPLDQVLNFAWSLPISVLITGAENKDLINEKIGMARSFSKLSENDRQKLVEKVGSIAADEKVEYYKKV